MKRRSIEESINLSTQRLEAQPDYMNKLLSPSLKHPLVLSSGFATHWSFLVLTMTLAVAQSPFVTGIAFRFVTNEAKNTSRLPGRGRIDTAPLCLPLNDGNSNQRKLVGSLIAKTLSMSRWSTSVLPDADITNSKLETFPCFESVVIYPRTCWMHLCYRPTRLQI